MQKKSQRGGLRNWNRFSIQSSTQKRSVIFSFLSILFVSLIISDKIEFLSFSFCSIVIQQISRLGQSKKWTLRDTKVHQFSLHLHQSTLNVHQMTLNLHQSTLNVHQCKLILLETKVHQSTSRNIKDQQFTLKNIKLHLICGVSTPEKIHLKPLITLFRPSQSSHSILD